MLCTADINEKSKSFDLDFFCIYAKKAIFHSFVYDFEPSHKSRRSRVYHQDEVLHNINSVGIVYHHCES